MNNSQLFKSVHKEVKRIIQSGDSYQATFGLCLRLRYANLRKQAKFAALAGKGFNKSGRRLYFNSRQFEGATVYLDLDNNKWVAKGFESRAAKAEAISIYEAA